MQIGDIVGIGIVVIAALVTLIAMYYFIASVVNDRHIPTIPNDGPTPLPLIEASRPASEKAVEDRHLPLFQDYHSESLRQSRISFWFSLAFASLGFIFIVLSLWVPSTKPDLQGSTGQAHPDSTYVKLVGGTIIEAVAALFFSMTNKSRSMMIDFFRSLRSDRNLSAAITLADAISDASIQSRLRCLLALHFAENQISHDVVRALLHLPEHLPDHDHSTPGESKQPVAQKQSEQGIKSGTRVKRLQSDRSPHPATTPPDHPGQENGAATS